MVVLVMVAMFTVTWLKSGKWWVWWYIGLNRDASNYKRAMQLNARGNAMDGNIERRGGNTVTWLPSTATHRLARHQQLWLKLSKIAKLWFPPPAPPHPVSGIFWRILICQTFSFVTNFGNLTEQWNMCAKCNEHKYGLFLGVSVAPAAILSKVNFLTGSQVFYSCCTIPLYICCTTPPLFINMVILAVSPSLAGALYGNVQTKKLCGNWKQPLNRHF